MANSILQSKSESLVHSVRVNLHHYLSKSGYAGPTVDCMIEQILSECHGLDSHLDSGLDPDGSKYFRQAMSLAVGKATEQAVRHPIEPASVVPPECWRAMDPCAQMQPIRFFRTRWWLEFLGFAEPRTVHADQPA